VTPKLDPQAFTIATVPKRLAAQKKDPWADFGASRVVLPAAKTKEKKRG
jgi:DNA primase